MTTTPIFKIEKASCSYTRNAANQVLYIENLEIHPGELIFLLGASGSGKTTLLEALGLMNNTLAGGEVTFYAEEKNYKYSSIWEEGNNSISHLRKKHFSFIFQNTNLMENFTAYENICLPRMIQEEVPQQEVMTEARQLMQKVGLGETQVAENTLAVNLSGGQKQRLSFVRALCSHCSVLFCDEPTGNLDESNANELMSLIRAEIAQKKITSIVVSHDIDLALNHASRIICVTKSLAENFGTIQPQNIFKRADWEHLGHEGRYEYRKKIKALYVSNADRTVGETKYKGHTKNFDNKFHNLFLRKEGRMLAGANFMNLWIMIFLFFFTFLSIGFANGSLAYLNTKLDNAFVNWMNIVIPYSQQAKLEDIKRDLSRPEIRKKYSIEHVTNYSEQHLSFKNQKNGKTVQLPCRSVEMNNGADPMIADITSKEQKHWVAGQTQFNDSKDLSLIVTEGFLNILGYEIETPFVYMQMALFDDSTHKLTFDTIPIGIRGVVKEIPGKVKCVYTDYFENAYMQKSGSTFDIKERRVIRFFCPGDKKMANEFRLLLDGWVQAHPNDAFNPEATGPDTCKLTHRHGYKLGISFLPVPETYEELNGIYKQLVADEKIAAFIKNKGVWTIYDYDNFTPRFIEKASVDKLSINFENLEHVREFGEYVRDTYNTEDDKDKASIIEPDLGVIQDKENFEFLANITKTTSGIIILLSTVAVCLFIFNMLKMHLAKVRMNIGTFTATGLSNVAAQLIYFEIILLFVLVSLIISIAAASGVGYLADSLLSRHMVVEQNISYFKINGLLTYLSVGLILVFSLLISYLTIRQMLSKSPGDLIYNR